ncbi:MAG: alanine racemase [Clostridia bacterium]|nr:alanine racemase [Clostridia bacterium]
MEQLKLKGTYASINLDHIVHNYKEACRLAGDDATVSCVVKADAYGHGEVQVVKALIENGLSLICVGTMIEALRLRTRFPDIDILILGYTPKFMACKVAENNLIQAISTLEEALALDAAGTTKVHLKVNTGMNRLGFPTGNVDEIAAISKLKNIRICGIFTHLHSSDIGAEEPTLRQFERFNRFLHELKDRGVNVGVRHVCNSAGIISFKGMHMDMVREGIMLYGLYPSKAVSRDVVHLKECMELHSYIAMIIDLKKGEGISYKHTFIAPHDMKIATVSLGYGDGVFRVLGNRGEVIICNERRPIVGNVCMNMFMVDVTGMDKVRVEDEVIIFGQSKDQFISIDEAAEWAGTISYEVICRTGCSVPRVYYKNGMMIDCEETLLIENEDNTRV